MAGPKGRATRLTVGGEKGIGAWIGPELRAIELRIEAAALRAELKREKTRPGCVRLGEKRGGKLPGRMSVVERLKLFSQRAGLLEISDKRRGILAQLYRSYAGCPDGFRWREIRLFISACRL